MRLFALLLALGLLVVALTTFRSSEARDLDPQDVNSPPTDVTLDSGLLVLQPGEVPTAERVEVLVERQEKYRSLPQQLRLRPDQIVEAFASMLPELFVASLADPDINEEWFPSRESLGYWIAEYQLGQIRDLDAEYVVRLVEGDGTEDVYNYVAALDGFDGKLSDLVEWPSDVDLDRLWDTPASRECFEQALVAKHKADLADDALWARLGILMEGFGGRDAIEADPEGWDAFREADTEYMGYQRLRDSLWSNEEQWWMALGRSDAAYPHWPFLLRVAYLHFQ